MKRLLLGSLIVLVLLGLTAYAQTFRGAINGSVTDPSGAVVSGATVKATNTATGVPISATTTTDGAFSFQDPPLRTHRIEVPSAAFRPVSFNNVPVPARSPSTLPPKLSATLSPPT